MTLTQIEVGGARPYPVLIGRGALGRLPSQVPDGAARVALIHQPALAAVARDMAQAMGAAGLAVSAWEIPPGEAGKRLEVAAAAWDRLGDAGFTRSDLVVGLGGGAATDLAGFVAATWLRGVDVIQVPTSVLGMVDAAVGGKTGINTAAGKNLVGAFHPPRAVVADLDLLATLPAGEVVQGFGEIVKVGFIADPQVLALIDADPAEALETASARFAELVARAVRVKADVVTQDLRESHLREILNYGHTFGHAIEQVENYSWPHGHAVAVGMVFAAELAHGAGLLSGDVVAEHRRVLRSVGLPTSYAAGRWSRLREAMGRDKKSRGSRLRFVVLRGIGEVTRLEDPDERLLGAAYAAVSEKETT